MTTPTTNPMIETTIDNIPKIRAICSGTPALNCAITAHDTKHKCLAGASKLAV